MLFKVYPAIASLLQSWCLVGRGNQNNKTLASLRESAELGSLGSMSAMNTSNIKPQWAFLAMLAAVPVAGLICAITEKDISMFYWSLAAVPLCAIVWPITLILMRLIPFAVIWIVGQIVGGAYRLFTGKR